MQRENTLNTDQADQADQADITVIVLLYNDMEHGLNAIESVLSQTYRNIKVKIMDNGSTDTTWSKIQKYQADPRVQLIRNNKNQKSEFAANEAFKTDTEYLSFLFADDIYLPNRLEIGLSTFKDDSTLSAIFFNNNFVDEKGRLLNKVPVTLFNGDISLFSQSAHLQHFFFKGNSLHPCGMLIKTKKYCEYGGFKPYFHRIGDMIFFTRLLANEKVGFVKEKMQKIMVWKNGRNESSQNLWSHSKISYEVMKFLQEYFSIATSCPAKLRKIFDGNEFTQPFSENEISMPFSENAEAFWYLGHQALSVNTPVYRLFGMNCLYYAAEMASEEFKQKIAVSKGITIAQYLDLAGDKYPPLPSAYFIKRLFAYVPFSRTIYKYLKNFTKNMRYFLLKIFQEKRKLL